ncbi:MAG: L-threonylcarbamoyladenylate synthase [Candidatus Sericytochromatia bacterium]
MKIFQVSPDNFKQAYMEETIKMLQKGEVVAFPTDTLYGLGADINNEDAIKKLYDIKQRPIEMPLILLGASKEQLMSYVLDWTPIAEKLSETFWPGGLTIILKKSFKVPEYVVSNMDSVGIRVPAHPVLIKILEEYGKPLATSSANLSGNPSPNTARVVSEELCDTDLALLLDAGKTPFSEQSTIIDLSGEIPLIIREGIISSEKVMEEINNII